MIGRHANDRIPRFSAIALVSLCVASIISVFLLMQPLSFLPWEENWLLRDPKAVIESSVAIDSDHVHVGDAFNLILRVAYRSEQVQMKDMSTQDVLQSGPLDILASQKTASIRGGIIYHEYRYKLQALNVLPGNRYTVKFAPLQYLQGNSDKAFSLPYETVDIVPRFLADANPEFASPYGNIQTYHQFVRWGMIGFAILLLCAGFMAAFTRLKKEAAVPASNPMDNLVLRLKAIDTSSMEARRALWELENIAIALAALHGVTALQLWQGQYPAHAHVPNPWEELWSIIGHAYDAAPNKEQAVNACTVLDALLTYHGTREER